ncbi:hypothetical protein [Tritonibacter aquimaris]|nr:hypothetical protein [Tritonibacter aquimaris]
MQKRNKVYGKEAPCARMTKTAALLVAIALSVPVFLVLTLVDLFLI